MKKYKSIQAIALLILLFTFSAPAKSAWAQLAEGDIYIIGMYSDGVDEFSWVPMVDLPQGTVIYFSDAGWESGNRLFHGAGQTDEWLLRFTAPAGGVPAGQVQTVIEGTSPPGYDGPGTTTNFGALAVGPTIDLDISDEGEELIAFQSTDDPSQSTFGNTNFTALFHLDTGSDARPPFFFDPAAPTVTTDLHVGQNGARVGLWDDANNDEFDNIRYLGITRAAPRKLLEAIRDQANWEGQNDDENSNWTNAVGDFIPHIDWNIAGSADWFDAANWDPTLMPTAVDLTLIRNGGTVTASSAGPALTCELHVGDHVNGGDGALNFDNVDLQVDRYMSIGGHNIDKPTHDDQMLFGSATIQNTGLFDVGSPNSGRVYVGVAAVGSSNLTIQNTGELTVSNVDAVIVENDIRAGDINFRSTNYGSANIEAGASINITNADNVTIGEDLDLAELGFGPSEQDAIFDISADFVISDVSGQLAIGEDVEVVSETGLTTEFAGTATVTGSMILNDIASISVEEDFEVVAGGGIDFHGGHQASTTLDGATVITNVPDFFVVEDLAISVIELHPGSGPLAGVIDVSGSVTLDNVAATVSTGRALVGDLRVGDAEPVSTATIDIDANLAMTDSFLSTPILEVAVRETTEVEADFSGKVEMTSSYIATDRLVLNTDAQLVMQIEGNTRVTADSVGEPGTYSAIDADACTLGGTLEVNFDFTPGCNDTFELITLPVGVRFDNWFDDVIINGLPDGMNASVSTLEDSDGTSFVVFLESAVAVPVDFEVITGELLGGDLPEIETSDDEYLQTRSGYGRMLSDLHHMEVEYRAISDCGSNQTVSITVESAIDQEEGTLELRVFNWDTNQFDLVASRPIGSEDSIESFENLDPTLYVSDEGETIIRVRHKVHRPQVAFTFESFIDRIAIFRDQP